MARKLRLEYPGAIYHVMNRGDRREPIFLDDEDRGLFLETLGQACLKTDWQVHAFCLMNHHFHLVVETPVANLVAGRKWFWGTYTTRFNRRHKLYGHLFSGRYKSLLVDGSGSGYLRTVCDYVHLNPVRARMLAAEPPLRQFLWSRFGQYVQRPQRRCSWIRVDRLLGEMGIGGDSADGRKRFEQMMEARRAADLAKSFQAVRRGWCLGAKEFRQELLAQMKTPSASHYGEELYESAEEKACRVLATELRRFKWAEKELERRTKGDRVKVRIAARLRRETTMTVAWIARKLKMGSRQYVAQLLAQERGSKR
jgi:REP element-mobilizing transposase RayT